MTIAQQIITILLCILGTMMTRFLPFLVFREDRETPAFVRFLGKYLPGAVFGMLVIYCVRNVDVAAGSHGLPELIAIALTAALHLWRRNMLLSVSAGTISYMLLIHFVF